MENFKFRTKRTFDDSYTYESVLDVIERIKSRCYDYKIRESFSGHLANAFDGMSLPVGDNEKFLHDDHMLFFDSADNLLNLNQSLSGERGWNAIADAIETKTGVGINDWHWKLNTYQLKPQYAQLLIDNLNDLEKEIRNNYNASLVVKEKKEREENIKRLDIRKSIVAINTLERTVTDEGGKTKEYVHTITFHNGEQLTFTERNVFDFGIVINPAYSVLPESKPGGLCLNNNGTYQWHEFIDGKGWFPVRELTENEKTALKYLQAFGKLSGCNIRM